MKLSRRNFIGGFALLAALSTLSARAARKNFSGMQEIKNARGRVADSRSEIFNVGAEIPDTAEELSLLRAQMSENYVVKSALSVPKPSHFKAFEDAAAASAFNGKLCKLVSNYKGEILPCALVPVCDLASALSELEKAKKSYGFFGAVIPTQVGGKFLEFGALSKIFEAAQALEMPIFAAPLNGASRAVARDAEIALFASNIACGNKLAAFKKLKIVLPSAGGSLPFSLARNSASPDEQGAFEGFFENFYYICGEAYEEGLFGEIRNAIPTSRLLFGASGDVSQALYRLRKVSNSAKILKGMSLLS